MVWSELMYPEWKMLHANPKRHREHTYFQLSCTSVFICQWKRLHQKLHYFTHSLECLVLQSSLANNMHKTMLLSHGVYMNSKHLNLDMTQIHSEKKYQKEWRRPRWKFSVFSKRGKIKNKCCKGNETGKLSVLILMDSGSLQRITVILSNQQQGPLIGAV